MARAVVDAEQRPEVWQRENEQRAAVERIRVTLLVLDAARLDAARRVASSRNADRIDGYDRDDLGLSEDR